MDPMVYASGMELLAHCGVLAAKQQLQQVVKEHPWPVLGIPQLAFLVYALISQDQSTAISLNPTPINIPTVYAFGLPQIIHVFLAMTAN